MLVLERNVNKIRRPKKVVLGQEKYMRAGDRAQRWNTWPACTRPWVLTPTSFKKTKKKKAKVVNTGKSEIPCF